MSCGISQPEHAVLIVEPTRLEELADNAVGEVGRLARARSRLLAQPRGQRQDFRPARRPHLARTGDLGFTRNGELFVTGRLKDMLIVRGHNLYPQDIEKTVESEVEVVRKGRVAAFAVNQDGEEGIGIAAEISRSVQKILPPEALIKAIRQAVAEAYQQAPSVVVLLNPGALPKTSSGKLQRSACRNRLADGSLDSYAVFPSDEVQGVESTLQGSELEALIGKIWAEQLNVKQVNADDHFFLLGGNSIAATQVIARVREELGLALSLRLLFEAPTLSAFAAAVALEQQNGASVQGTINALSRTEPMPQSLAQNRLWITWQLDPQSSAYNIPGALRLRGELDEDALRASFQQLIERHESLRTRFFERDGVALQQVDAAAEFNLQLVDISDLPTHEREARAEQIREDEARTRFDLEKGPLIRVTLIRLDDEDHKLLVTMHHIIADGWSLNVLIDEFSRLYAAAAQGQRTELAALPTQYAD